MGKEYTAKSFKSGNSVAIRMPAALGVEPDREWVITEEAGQFTVKRKDAPKRKFNIDKVWGSAIGSGLCIVEDRTFEPRPTERDVAG